MSFVMISEAKEVNSMKIRSFFILVGEKIDNVRKDCGHSYQITAVAYYHASDMISGGGLMISFAGFLRVVVVRWLSECSWRLSSGISGILMGTPEVVLDHDYGHLLHGNAIKQRLLIYATVWHARDIALVVLWFMTKRLVSEI